MKSFIKVNRSSILKAAYAHNKLVKKAAEIIDRLKKTEVTYKKLFFFKKTTTRYLVAKSLDGWRTFRHNAHVLDYISHTEMRILWFDREINDWKKYLEKGEEIYLSHEDYLHMLTTIELGEGLK